jgi:DNA-binding transcriptional ArsR family regulator
MERYHDVHPFQALGDPVRRRIIDVLASGEHTAGQIADLICTEFHLSRTATSKHLRILRDAGLVDVRAELQWRWYRLDSRGVGMLEHALLDLRSKVDGAIGWDAEHRREYDPLAPFRPARKGLGRPQRAGTRGRQTVPVRGSDPDAEIPPRTLAWSDPQPLEVPPPESWEVDDLVPFDVVPRRLGS